MGSFWFNLKYTFRHPDFLWQYLTRVSSIADLLDVDGSQVRSYLREYKEVNSDIEKTLKGLPYLGQMDRRKNEVLYVLVRVLKPAFAVETGVGAGVSSAIILRAMSINGQGVLYSIDAGFKNFDGVTLPHDKPVGFIVPEDLRKRWHLIIGLSKAVLEPTLKNLGSIDFFFHDSEHSYGNMMFEYETAWQYLRKGGLLASDNIEWNKAFDDFCKKHKAPYKKFYSFGAIRKV